MNTQNKPVVGYQISSLTPLLGNVDDMKRAMERTAGMGYPVIQLQNVSTDIPNGEIRKALSESGLTCVATQEDYVLGFDKNYERAIERAVETGSEYLTVAWFPKGIDTVDKVERLADHLMKIKEAVEEAGLTFSYHPLPPDYQKVDGSSMVERLMDLLGDRMQLTYCPCASFDTGVTEEEVFEKFAGRMDLVHFKETKKQEDGTVVMTPLGEGDHDYQKIYEQCLKSGVRYIFTEQEKHTGDPFEDARRSLAYMRNLEEKYFG